MQQTKKITTDAAQSTPNAVAAAIVRPDVSATVAQAMSRTHGVE